MHARTENAGPRAEPSASAILLRLAILTAAAPLLIAAMSLLFVATTVTGFMGAGTGFVAVVWLVGLAAPLWRRRFHRWLLWILGATVLIGTGILAMRGLRRTSETATSRVLELAWGDNALPARWSAFRCLPEQDQLALGSLLMTAADPLLTSQQGSSLRGLIRDVYAEADLDPEFASTNSALGSVFDDMIGRRSMPTRAFAYVPKSLDRTRPAPVVVFFHGAGGCWRGYLWVWSRIAEATGAVVLCPDGGWGAWDLERVTKSARGALEALEERVLVDRNRIHLAGLSNGGLAVCRSIHRAAIPVRSIVLISPVLDELTLDHFGSPVLVLSGAADDRVPLRYVEHHVHHLKSRGVRIENRIADGAGHFLILSHRDIVAHEVTDWLRRER